MTTYLAALEALDAKDNGTRLRDYLLQLDELCETRAEMARTAEVSEATLYRYLEKAGIRTERRTGVS